MTNNAKCWHYKAKDSQANANCPNCEYWGWTRCKDEKLLMEGFKQEPKPTEPVGWCKW